MRSAWLVFVTRQVEKGALSEQMRCGRRHQAFGRFGDELATLSSDWRQRRPCYAPAFTLLATHSASLDRPLSFERHPACAWRLLYSEVGELLALHEDT